jgi:hypothetical protein
VLRRAPRSRRQSEHTSLQSGLIVEADEKAANNGKDYRAAPTGCQLEVRVIILLTQK